MIEFVPMDNVPDFVRRIEFKVEEKKGTTT